MLCLRTRCFDCFPIYQCAERSSATRALQLLRRADAVPAPFAHHCFYNAVFTGMVRDNRDHTIWLEHVAQHRQRALERAKLIVYRNANPLEDSGEITGTGPCTKSAANCVNEIIAGGKGNIFAAANDLMREPTSARLIGVLAKNANEI